MEKEKQEDKFRCKYFNFGYPSDYSLEYHKKFCAKDPNSSIPAIQTTPPDPIYKYGYKCPLCNEQFLIKSNLVKHIQKYHPENFKTLQDSLKKSNKDEGYVKSHIDKPNLICHLPKGVHYFYFSLMFNALICDCGIYGINFKIQCDTDKGYCSCGATHQIFDEIDNGVIIEERIKGVRVNE